MRTTIDAVLLTTCLAPEVGLVDEKTFNHPFLRHQTIFDGIEGDTDEEKLVNRDTRLYDLGCIIHETLEFLLNLLSRELMVKNSKYVIPLLNEIAKLRDMIEKLDLLTSFLDGHTQFDNSSKFSPCPAGELADGKFTFPGVNDKLFARMSSSPSVISHAGGVITDIKDIPLFNVSNSTVKIAEDRLEVTGDRRRVEIRSLVRSNRMLPDWISTIRVKSLCLEGWFKGWEVLT